VPTDSKTIDWILRVAVALQCAGYAWLVGVVGESPLLGWLWEPHDVGGLALGEQAAIRVTQAVALFLAVAAVSTLVRPSRLLLAGVVAFQVVYATATWQIHDGFPLDVAWLGTGAVRAAADRLVPLFPFAASGARIAAPLVLIMVHWSRLRRLLGVAISPASEWTMRLALSLTFAAHGLESLDRRGSFLDLLILAAQNLLDVRLPEAVAQWLLVGIGVVDLAVAVLVLMTRWRTVAGYMAVWGFVTAAARIVVLNADTGWYEFAIRSAHWALPLVLVLAWRLARPPTSVVE
jgi:hypothetical protein